MMAPLLPCPSHLANALATPLQLETSASQLDGVPKDLEDSICYQTSCLLQAAGILLRLPQDIIASAIIILQRFWIGPDGGSLLEIDAQDAAAASLYLSAKPSAHTLTPRQTMSTFAYLRSIYPDYHSAASGTKPPENWHISESSYQASLSTLYHLESLILRTLSFPSPPALPYTLALTYIQTLSLPAKALAPLAFANLNTALLSPQLLYLTHQPSALAVAAIYLAAAEAGEVLEGEWWEVFDVEREELGFLVLSIRSLEGWVRAEKGSWGKRTVPLDVEGTKAEVERRAMLERGE